jgi:hypothetical protein
MTPPVTHKPPEPNEPPGDASPDQTPPAAGPPRAALPPYRRLRAFAFDPLLSNQLDTASINEITLPVVWEEDLQPGPVGEYLEVVDYDPAGGCAYEPVDLNDPHLLATDGLAPSEGNPQFHQQMVYAVAMTTIRHFEAALGRKAQWAPIPYDESASGEDEFVQRLRVYPHALREANAYYSPPKRALLFGYFPASVAARGRNLPGGTVFTCLSHDIVTHETTHALLDGMHQRFIEASNPDVPAFHEAFADIVALFQHFAFPEVLRSQIARTRGDLALESLLGQLAQQFGEAIGQHGALRDALGGVNPRTGAWEPLPPDPDAYRTTLEPHARGSLLVAAVFDAFLAIYRIRIADLLRIATGGTGVLPAGALHPDLVARLAREAAKAAEHVLTMCIRALDYCPPVDLTFGEYLRALITADTELIEDDDLGYRIAMIEAFRRRGLYPLSVRTLAPDSLLWQGAERFTDQPDAVWPCVKKRELLKRLNDWNLSGPRAQMFKNTQDVKRFLHGWLADVFRAGDVNLLQELTGLALADDAPHTIERGDDGRPKFEVHAVRPARRVGPDGQLVVSLIVEVTQERAAYDDPQRQDDADPGRRPVGSDYDFVFRGGCTLVFDLETARPRYFIRKNIRAEGRLKRQRDLRRGPAAASLRATYFGRGDGGEPFALLHRDG